MLIDFDEILRDLELKRAAAATIDVGFKVDLPAALAGHDGLGVELALVEEDGGERPLTFEHLATPVADALATLSLASGESAIDTAAVRAIIRAVTTEVSRRLQAAAADGAERITAYDLSALVEASLIATGYFEIAKALVLRRAVTPLAAGNASRPTGTLRLIRRSGEVAGWQPIKIEIAIRKAFLSRGESQGVVPFLKMHNDQLVAVNQGGKRAGSGCAYLEVWHNDIREFLELRRNTGDERRRTHDMNTACWIPDLFMQRMEAREDWTLFRSSDVPDLHETYGAEFERRYVEYERRAAAGEIFGETIPAIELWKQMLKMLFETGHPWLTFKDPCNLRSPQDHVGVIHSSNLCTEITLNTGPEETAVCNLGSILLDQHLTPDGQLDHAKLRDTIRIAVRALDNVIDVNFYPTEPARTANSRHRPVGLGVMGLQYALYRKRLAFDSAEAIAFSDEAFEAVAHYAYEASSDLAAERGTYRSYRGSKWDRGLLPQDTIELLEAERGETVEVAREGRIDWAPLRAKIAAQGMRNSNVLAIAPTATIANITGTSPCIEPMYKNLFAKSNLSGDFVIVNPFLVRDLKAAGLWTHALAEQLKARDGDLTDIPEIPSELKSRYRTAFQIPADALIDAAARRQKWIDQSQSLNLFLPEPDMKTMSHMYRRAWHAGLKTTYYLRTLGASSIEKATVTAVQASEPLACSVEAARNGEECEVCQ